MTTKPTSSLDEIDDAASAIQAKLNTRTEPIEFDEALPPRPWFGTCPTWCTWEQLHEEDLHPDDRHHWGARHRVGLSREAPGHDGHRWTGHWAQAYLARAEYEIEPRIHLGMDGKAGFYMSPSEARALAAILCELAEQAELTTRSA